MYAEDIYTAASAMCTEESELLRLLSASAEAELLKRLKPDVSVQDIKALFITAGAMLVCSMCSVDDVKSWSAGQVSVTGGDKRQDMRDRAEALLAGYLDSCGGFDFRGVMG